jgi:signal peptidase I
MAEPNPTPPEGGSPLSLLRHPLRSLWRLLGETLKTVLPALIIALFINTFVAQAMVVQGPSMQPTLHYNERVVVEKLTYRLAHGPRRGDVIVVEVAGQEDPLIKRVVGLPGETIAVQNGRVTINGRPLEEPWAILEGGQDYPPTLVPPLHVFVLGDNRGQSQDSRAFGPVRVDDVIGRAWVIYWPPSQIGVIR